MAEKSEVEKRSPTKTFTKERVKLTNRGVAKFCSLYFGFKLYFYPKGNVNR